MIVTENNIETRLSKTHLYLTALSLASLPFGGLIVSYSLVLLIVNWLYGVVVNKRLSKISITPKLLSVVGLYLLYLVGLLYTSNYTYAFRDLETKMSMLFIPIVFSSLPGFSLNQFKFLSKVFIGACVFSFLFCVGFIFFKFGFSQPEKFSYTSLSIFIHPGYFSIYMSVAVALVSFLSSVDAGTNRWSRISGVIIIAFILVAQLMLAAKMPLVISFMLVIAAVSLWLYRLNKIRAVIGFVIMAVTIVLVVMNIESVSNRFHTVFEAVDSQQIDFKTTESSKVRVLVWKASVEAIKDNGLIGVGTGDIMDTLRSYYQQAGYIGALDHNLNTHNQFLQTTLALGIPGFIALMFMFFNSINAARKQKDTLYLRLIFIYAISCLTESVFETQAGVCSFVLLNSIFLFSREKETASPN